jgi:hypothetical protein
MSTCIKSICFDFETKRIVVSLHHSDRNENKNELVQKPQENNENQKKTKGNFDFKMLKVKKKNCFRYKKKQNVDILRQKKLLNSKN